MNQNGQLLVKIHSIGVQLLLGYQKSAILLDHHQCSVDKGVGIDRILLAGRVHG